MYCNPTLTVEEFKTVHNALCDLRDISDRLENVLHPDLFVKISRAVTNLSAGLKGAYKQDDLAYVKKRDHYEQVQKDLNLTDSIWSIFEADNLNDRHPFENVKEVVYSNHWGPKTVRVAINGSTWAALYVAANAAIRDSQDTFHLFIENFTQNGEELNLTTGS